MGLKNDRENRIRGQKKKQDYESKEICPKSGNLLILLNINQNKII